MQKYRSTSSYGQIEADVEAVEQRFRYTGRFYDKDTGLYHYRARAYDPETGRFLQEDPIWFAAGDLNVHRYVWNNPLNWNDPSGLVAAISYGRIAATTGAALVGTVIVQQNAEQKAASAQSGLAGIGSALQTAFSFISAALSAVYNTPSGDASPGNSPGNGDNGAGDGVGGGGKNPGAPAGPDAKPDAPDAPIINPSERAGDDEKRVEEQKERRRRRREDRSREENDQTLSGEGFRDRAQANKGPSGKRPEREDVRRPRKDTTSPHADGFGTNPSRR